MTFLEKAALTRTFKTIFTLFLLSSLLTACGSPDEEGMKVGLQKSGLNPEQATCYSGVLKPVIKADVYNDFATFLMQGKSLKGAIKQARLKHGENLVDGMSKVKDKLADCLK